MKMTTAKQHMQNQAQASAQSAHKGWTRKLIPGAIAAAFLALGCTSAGAIEFSEGEWSGSFDTTVSYGAAWRASDLDEDFIGKGAINPTSFLLTNAEKRASPGRWSVNNDDGNRNYPEGGDLISNTVKLTSELDVRYKNYGAFTRFTAFYDFENHNKDFLSDKAIDRVCKDFRLLDLYVWGENEIGERFLNWRLGRQVVSWGESTFIQGGINVINPVDVSRLRVAGAELKEAFEGVNMIWGSIDLTPNLSMEALYMFEYREIIPDPAGAYFSTNDFGTPGGSYVMLGFGSPDQPVINPDLYETVCMDGNYGASDQPYPPEIIAVGCGGSVPRTETIDPSDSGQWGLAFRYFAEKLNGTEFGFYYLNYHSRLPLNSGLAVTGTSVTTGRYFTEYPEDIHLWGASFNSNIGTWALSGEVSYRPNLPLQVDDVELLFAALTPLNVLFPAHALQFHSQLGDFEAGDLITGYERFNSWQTQFTTTKLFGPGNFLKANQIAFVAEVGMNYVSDLPDEKELRFNGPGTDTGGGYDFLTGDLRNPITETDGFADDFSWGYRMLIRAEYNDAIGPMTVSPTAAKTRLWRKTGAEAASSWLPYTASADRRIRSSQVSASLEESPVLATVQAISNSAGLPTIRLFRPERRFQHQLHVVPGTSVSQLVVTKRNSVFLAVDRSLRVGEPMERARQRHEQAIRFCLAHLGLESLDFLRAEENVVLAVIHGNPCGYLTALTVGRDRERQRAVKRSYRIQVGAVAGHVEHNAATHAVADRGRSGRVSRGMRPDLLQGRVEPVPHGRHIGEQSIHQLAGLVRILRQLSAAVQVQRHARVAEFRQHVGPAARILVVAPPLVHDQHPGPLPIDLAVPGEITLHLDAIGAVSELL